MGTMERALCALLEQIGMEGRRRMLADIAALAAEKDGQGAA